MKNFQEKNRYRKIIQSKPVLIILGICLVFFIFNIVQLTSKAIETKKNREIAENKINELQTQKSELEYKIQKLNTEKGMEENIREKFGLGKEGEGMIVIVDEKEKIKNEEIENSSKFLNFFKNLF
jgi:cell division protein FtsB